MQGWNVFNDMYRSARWGRGDVYAILLGLMYSRQGGEINFVIQPAVPLASTLTLALLSCPQ